MFHYVYKTSGVCSQQIDLDIDGDVVRNVVFTGGCNGNLKGISKLVDGMKAEDIVDKLAGTLCGSKDTSCPDQLSKAVSAALKASE